MNAKGYWDTIQARRSFYSIDKNVTLPDDQIEQIIKDTLYYVPSAFNSQTTRIVLLYQSQHDRLWEITRQALKRVVPPEAFGATDDKIKAFENGYATILFFEDQAIVKNLQENFPLYSQNFPIWSQQTAGMHQFTIWSALSAQGLGASLQHYGEMIEPQVKKEWVFPEEWKLIAQMPFGNPTAMPGEKERVPMDTRFFVKK